MHEFRAGDRVIDPSIDSSTGQPNGPGVIKEIAPPWALIEFDSGITLFCMLQALVLEGQGDTCSRLQGEVERLKAELAASRAEAERLRVMLADVADTLGCSDRDHNREWAEEIRAALGATPPGGEA